VAQLFSLGSIATPQQIHIMKLQTVSLLCMVTVGTALLCGCYKTDPKIAMLEKRLSQLEADRVSDHADITTNYNVAMFALDMAIKADSRTTNMMVLMDSTSDLTSRMFSLYKGLENRVTALEVQPVKKIHP
jgi:hypothetical protein